MTITYPLDLVNVTPGEGFTPLPVPEGEAIHTGGLYLSPDRQEVWKPLDVRPYANAELRVPSREAEVLEVMADEPGFPRNWRIQEVNGRQFLVRPKCRVIGQNLSLEMISQENIIEIEQWVRSLNSRFWEVNDYITIAFDKNLGELFILDLSAAQQMGGVATNSAWLADDTSRFYQFATKCGYKKLVKLRHDAHHLTSSIAWLRMQEDENSPLTENHEHIYGSRNRPIDSSWAKIPGAVYMDGNVAETRMWTWVVTPEPLPEDLVRRYELTWAYSPIPYQR